MNTQVLEKSKIYQVFNDIALKNEIVVFGSSYAAQFPFYEASRKYYLDNAIYNRSIEGLTLTDAERVIDDCVLAVKPSKVFLSLGECDEENDNSLEAYGRILYRLKKELPSASVYVMSVINRDAGFNKSLESLCEKNGATFIQINYTASYSAIFKQLSRFFRKGNITFCDAFKIS